MSIRLNALCSLIPVCKLLIDVGCDHGFVAGYALANGLCERAIASDISEGSLSKARKNLSQFPNAQTRLGDGLSVLKEGEDPDVIVIAGMGGSLICEILALYRGGAKLILGAQKDLYRLREFLADNGFNITEDFTVKDRNKFYDIIGASRGECKLDEMQKKFGAFYKRKNPFLREKCLFDLRRLKNTPRDVNDIKEVIKWQQL